MASTSSGENSICGISLCLETFPSNSSFLQLAGYKPGVNITHRRCYLKRALANNFNSVTASALFLQDCLTSCGQLRRVGST